MNKNRNRHTGRINAYKQKLLNNPLGEIIHFVGGTVHSHVPVKQVVTRLYDDTAGPIIDHCTNVRIRNEELPASTATGTDNV